MYFLGLKYLIEYVPGPSYRYVNNNRNGCLDGILYRKTSYINLYGLFDGITLVQQDGTEIGSAVRYVDGEVNISRL